MNAYQGFAKQNYSFNRYMVECEYTYINGNLYNSLILIDTWWNVNQEQAQNLIRVNGF